MTHFARRPPTVLLLVVCISTAACMQEARMSESAIPTAAVSPAVPRVTEARLTGFGGWQRCTATLPPGRVVEQSECGTRNIPPDLVSITVGECNRLMRTRADAARLLAYVPDCTDAAVSKLETLSQAGRDPFAVSDLSAAYSIRAQRKDQAADLVRALAAAERAVRLAPTMAEARFNRALAQEALGFTSDAIRSWDELRRHLPGQWAAEAEQHWKRLTRERTIAAAVQWPLNQERLPGAARAGDRSAVAQLIEPYRDAARRYVEETVLPAWAVAAGAGRASEAKEHLALAEMIASALAQSTGDRYLLDAVNTVRNSRGSRTALQKGHLTFRDARAAEIAQKIEIAAPLYRTAEQSLTNAGSPLRLGAALGQVTALAFAKRYDQAFAQLRTIERAAKKRKYDLVVARVHSARGFLFTVQGRNPEALAEYGEAQVIFERCGDTENISKVHTRKIGLARLIGHHDLTWRELVQARRHLWNIYDTQPRHLFLGESALAAVELGQPAIALQYQNEAVRLAEDELANNRDERRVTALRNSLGVALRGRASIRVRLRDYRGAQADLDQASRLMQGDAAQLNTQIVSGFRARLAEVQAETLAANDRKRAIATLGEALRHASATHYHALVASLLLQRANLHRLERNRAAALEDLRNAVSMLRREEEAMLNARARLEPHSEKLWTAFFSRHQEAYRRLIRHLVEDGNDTEAFEYAEKARAFEPLHLILQRKDLPSAFRAWNPDGQPFRLEQVKRLIPANTYLLQYCVLDDRTYVWIIGNGASQRKTLPVPESRIADWSASLQRFASLRDIESFRAALSEPHRGLLAEALTLIPKPKSAGNPPRLVVVPDRSMHGLPFAALRGGERFVIQDHTISIAASATLYAFSLAQDQQHRQLKPELVSLFADPAFSKKLDVARGLAPLPRTRTETARIERVYKPFVEVARRMDGSATIPELLALARRSSVIHIAVHGVANPDTPSRSFLLLAPTGNDSGALEAERLLKELRVERARLAVLSACSSAGGTPVGPEGLAPLVRPVIAAGVPGVIGTLWNVGENAATEELLVRFHQHYREGKDADRALQLAQVSMLEDPDLGRSAPFAWAPFQMIGYASSPFPVSEKRRER